LSISVVTGITGTNGIKQSNDVVYELVSFFTLSDILEFLLHIYHACVVIIWNRMLLC